MEEEVTIWKQGDHSVSLTEHYSDEALGQFIDRLTSEPQVFEDFQQDPEGSLSGIGIEIEGDSALTREQWITSIGQDGLPGYQGTDAMAARGEDALLGPAIIIVAIVLYPSEATVEPRNDLDLSDPNLNNMNIDNQEGSN